MSKTDLPQPFVLRGRWLWSGEALVERGGLLIEGGRIATLLRECDPDPAGAEVVDLPRVLIHPGLHNGHGHLDLSHLSGAISPGLPFTGWLLKVRELRARAGAGGLLDAARDGIRALIESGTTSVVDFSHGGHSEKPLRESGLRAVVLREVIGPTRRRAEEVGPEARAWLDTRTPGPGITHGLAPHSPYLATGDLIRDCRNWAGSRPFSIHAAEVPAEGEFLRRGTGELLDFLLEASGGAYVPGKPAGVGTLEYLDRLDALKGTLLVHASSLEAGDISRIRERGAAVAYCPRTHDYFHRPPHPLPDLLAAGIHVVLGTDSAASSGILSVAEEMRQVRGQFPSIPTRAIFTLGTGGGRMEPGRPADLAGAELSEGSRDPLEAFLSDSAPNRLTISGGRILFLSPR